MTRRNTPVDGINKPVAAIINLTCLQVEKAMMRLTSGWATATNPAKIEVAIPSVPMNGLHPCEVSIKEANDTSKKTPAVTSVAAWIRALTGVGASIALGSQA